MYFRFLNIPVFIHPTFWLFLLFFTNIYRELAIESLIAGIVMFFSLLVHEYGHALTALYFGAKPTINFEAFGGNAQYNTKRMTRNQELLITLNGPLLESMLIVVSYGLLEWNLFSNYPYIQYFLALTMKINIIWCLFNLVPILPLDGGRLLYYLLEKKWGDAGYKPSLITGLIAVVLIAPYLYIEGLVFFGTLLLIFGFLNFQKLRETSLQERSNFRYDDATGKAKKIFKKLLKSKDMQIRNSALESLAKIYFQENERQKAYDLLLKTDHRFLNEGKCLLCKLAFEKKNYALISKYSRDIYGIEPTYDIALLNSKAFALLKQPSLSGAWLNTASQFGPDYASNIEELLADPTFDFVRDQAAFKQYANQNNVSNT